MASGWWDNDGAISGCVAAYAAVGAASLAASYVNLQNPGPYDCGPGVAPTFNASTGWTFNGTTQYLDIPPAALTGATAYTVVMRCNITAGAKRGLFGFLTSPNVDVVFIESDRQLIRTSGSTGNLNVALTTGADAVWSHAWGSSNAKVYKAGVEAGSVAAPSAALAAPAAVGLQIGRDVGSGGGAYYMLGTIAAVALYTVKLSPAEQVTMNTRMLALPVASGSPLPLFAAQLMAMR